MGITDLMDVSLSELRELVMDGEAGVCACVRAQLCPALCDAMVPLSYLTEQPKYTPSTTGRSLLPLPHMVRMLCHRLKKGAFM